MLYFTFYYFRIDEEEFADKYLQMTFACREEKKKNVEFGKVGFEQKMLITTSMLFKWRFN